MVARAGKKAAARKTRKTRRRPLRAALRFVWRWAWRGAAVAFALVAGLALLFALVNPPRGIYMQAEAFRLGGISRDWVALEDISAHLPRAVVAAEDANFCLHWGFDMAAIREAIAEGGRRGASTISQQAVKNVFLWHGRSWPRKALEALITPLAEAVWTKRRMLEIYLNVAEFDEGVFGAEAAARHYFGVAAANLTLTQSARLAAVLPDPKNRSAARPSAWLRQRAAAVRSGAETIRADGRAACFES
ncbi:monofunctional biosynthetic peptidoglycan transglycosylase [Maritimibacter sp. 55A14]|uniref:monofunctional biosynthetic peptidoglycan transglycosylase n=1 Tax=Maritimibacter sp. 55A14 TaxID=2174844 RepID=UPI000D60C5F0|nr:monofunctional biosynthetic peptidoglycan transglycosylase [Maritimibacter sp. 55A14]PWE33599.1 monofunctional biosynthetic peptidoglycan transglycosylase [Maritimibacter sp. 55A14]